MTSVMTTAGWHTDTIHTTSSKKPRLITVTDNRDGTGRDCFDLFGGECFDGGTGRDGKMRTNIVGGAGRDGTVGVQFLYGTGR